MGFITFYYADMTFDSNSYRLYRINTFVFKDERLLEYDIDKLVFEARSPYQKVQIVHSKSLGNLLVLDELQSTYFYNHHIIHLYIVSHKCFVV